MTNEIVTDHEEPCANSDGHPDQPINGQALENLSPEPESADAPAEENGQCITPYNEPSKAMAKEPANQDSPYAWLTKRLLVVGYVAKAMGDDALVGSKRANDLVDDYVASLPAHVLAKMRPQNPEPKPRYSLDAIDAHSSKMDGIECLIGVLSDLMDSVADGGSITIRAERFGGLVFKLARDLEDARSMFHAITDAYRDDVRQLQ